MERLTPPGTYTLRALVTVAKDGSQVWERVTWAPVVDIQPDQRKNTLAEIWKENGLITFNSLVYELNRQGIINDHHQWQWFETRGGKRTCARTVKGAYEFLVKAHCIDPLSMDEVMDVFNNTFNTQINSARVLRGECRGNPEFYFGLFGLPEDKTEGRNLRTRAVCP